MQPINKQSLYLSVKPFINYLFLLSFTIAETICFTSGRNLSISITFRLTGLFTWETIGPQQCILVCSLVIHRQNQRILWLWDAQARGIVLGRAGKKSEWLVLFSFGLLYFRFRWPVSRASIAIALPLQAWAFFSASLNQNTNDCHT